MSMVKISSERKTFEAADGTTLSYLEAGHGQPLVLVHGWSQSAEQFRYQFNAFSASHHVIAFDQRGHGLSSRPEYGYRVSRLAMDLRELLVGLDLDDVAILGHSMGCSVIWCYLDLFGEERLKKLILVDQPPCLTINPVWGPQEVADAGALFSPAAAADLCNALNDDESGEFSNSLMASMLTAGCPGELRDWMMGCNRQMRRAHAAALMRNHANIDWRDTIARIRLPTLAIGAEASLAPAPCMPWVARQIPGARLEMFGAGEGGSHFMFVENPEKFNRLVLSFLS
jgi:pimeloyl-ACP methyl ester carboxylesterase